MEFLKNAAEEVYLYLTDQPTAQMIGEEVRWKRLVSKKHVKESGGWLKAALLPRLEYALRHPDGK